MVMAEATPQGMKIGLNLLPTADCRLPTVFKIHS